MTVYHRYRLDDGRYWGSTDVLNDDPECGYTEIDTPEYEPMDAIAVWQNDHWQIINYNTGELGDSL